MAPCFSVCEGEIGIVRSEIITYNQGQNRQMRSLMRYVL